MRYQWLARSVLNRRRSPGAEWLVAALLVSVFVACAPQPMVPPPPETRTDDVSEVLHGVELSDPYRWLEDQESPETRQWIEVENDYTDSVLGQLPGQEELEARFSLLMKVEEATPPLARNGRYFFTKRAADQDLFVVYLRQGLEGTDEVLLDPHPLSDDHTTSFELLDVSNDATLMAYGIREGGEDELTVKLFDVNRRQDLADVLPRGRYYGVAIAPDNQGIYYTRLAEQGPRTAYHAVGAAVETDREIFGEGYGPEKIVFADLSDDGRYLLIHVLHGSAARKIEVYLKDLSRDGEIQTVVNDLDAAFFAGFGGDEIFLRTNWQAPKGRVLAASVQKLERENWREVVPERPEATIKSLSGVGGKLFVNYLENVQSRLIVFESDGSEVGEIEFGTMGTVGGYFDLWDSLGPWQADEAFVQFDSFHVPESVYRYQVSSGEHQLWHRTQVPIDSESIEIQQVWYESKDGTRVPMFLVYRKGLELDGSNPTLLTGYGGFNVSLTPRFSARAAVWAESGGVYAVANLRGGGEFGEEWHRAGMQESKQNTFDDFIAAAEWLIEQGYTRPEKLAIRGGSNGGLLVGAVMNQRPELFEAVVCTYPLLDMVRYHQFLVAGYWIPEYGSSDDPEQFQTLYAYSPYHNVRSDLDYPAVLYITGDGDTRVAPLHARKMAALMQSQVGSKTPVLLRYHTKAGHSGGQPVSEQISNLTESFSFLFWQLGVEI